MGVKLVLAAVLAFGASAAFGKWYVPWLAKHGARQPIKDEVAVIYAEKEKAAAPGESATAEEAGED